MISLLVKPCEPVGALGGLFDALSLLLIENRTAEYGVRAYSTACLGGSTADRARSRSPAELGEHLGKDPEIGSSRIFLFKSMCCARCDDIMINGSSSICC